MTTNAAGAASGKKRVLVTIGGLVAAAGITAGVLAMAGGGEQQDRALVQADEASQDSSRSGRGTRARATKADPTSSNVDAMQSTATEAGADGGAAVAGDTTTGATAGATTASAPGGKASAGVGGGPATGTAGGSTNGGPTGGGAAGSGTTGGGTGTTGGGSTGGGTTGGGTTGGGSTGGGTTGGDTTGGAAIAPPVTQAPPPPPPPAPPAAQCIAGGANSNAVAVAQRFCDHRASRGLAVMTRNSRLDAAAQARAERMASTGVIDHTGFEDQVRGACAACTYVGENLADWPTVAQAWSFWLGSSAHAPNLNRPGAGEFGVGAATTASGNTIFVHLFGWY